MYVHNVLYYVVCTYYIYLCMPGTFDATFELFLYENIVLVILVNLNQNINPHKSEFACGQSHFCQSLFV